MITGKLNQIHKDHKEWISQIEFCKKEIQVLSKIVHKIPNEKEYKFQNDLDHHQRLLDKLNIAIRSHQAFLAELAHEDLDSLDMLDIEGHNRNKLHFKNLSESFSKLRNDIKHIGEKRKLQIH